MLGWAVLFLVIALIAGVLGFTGVAVAAASIAKIIFLIFIIFFFVSLLLHFFGSGFESLAMLESVVTFLIIAIIAGVLGFTGIQVISIEFARVLFFIFLVLFCVSLFMNLTNRGRK